VSEVWTDTTAFPLAVEVADDDQLPMADMSATAGSRQRNMTGAVARAQLGGAGGIASAPGAGDDSADGYRAGSLVLTAAGALYVCTDATAGAAVWQEFGVGSGNVVGPASAVNNNIAVFDGTTGKLLKDGGATIASITAAAGGRTLLVASTTLYVDGALGSDLNDGTSSGAGAFATIQKGINVASKEYDLQGFDLTISVAAGTYAENIELWPLTGGGRCIVLGDAVTPANVVIDPASGTAVNVPGVGFRDLASTYRFDGVKIIATSDTGFYVRSGTVELANIDFGAADQHVLAEASGVVVFDDDYTVSATANIHLWTRRGGTIILNTLTATFNSVTWAIRGWWAQWLGRIIVVGTVANAGTATGQKHLAERNGVIDGTASAPGSTAGTTATGGQAA